MSLDIMSISIRAESNGVDAATKSLNNLVDASEKAESSTTNLTTTVKKTNSAYAEGVLAADKLITSYQKQVDLLGANTAQTNAYNVAMKNGSAAQQATALALGAQVDAYRRLASDQSEAIRLNRDIDKAVLDAKKSAQSYLESLKAQTDTIGLSNKQLREHQIELMRTRAAALGVTDAAEPMIQKFKESALHAGHASSGISGIFRELLVLGHEASQGQYTRLGGSMIVLGERADIAGKFAAWLTERAANLGTTVAGLLVPILAATAALGVMAAALMTFKHSFDAVHEFNKELILTGNAAGTTGEQLYDMSDKIGRVYGAIGDARKVMAELTATGKFSVDQIKMITEAAVGLSTYGGVAIDSIVKQFEKLAKEPLGNTERSFHNVSKAAMELDQQLHFLNPTTLQAILDQESMGKSAEASAIAIKALSDVEKARVIELKENMTWLGAKAHDVAAAFTNMWNSMFVKESVIDQLKKAQDRLDRLSPREKSGFHGQQLVNEVADLSVQLSESQVKADTKANEVAKNSAANIAKIWLNSIQEKAKGETMLDIMLRKNLEQEAAVRENDANDIFLSERSMFERRAYLQKEYGEKIKKERAQGVSGLDATIKELEAQSQAVTTGYNNQLELLENLHKYERISDQIYAEAKKETLGNQFKNTQKFYEAEISAMNKSLEEEKRTQSEKNIINGKIAETTKLKEKALASYTFQGQLAGMTEENTLLATQKVEAKAFEKTVETSEKAIKLLQDKVNAYNMLPESVRAAGVSEKQMQDSVTQSRINSLKEELAQVLENNDAEEASAKLAISRIRQKIDLAERFKSVQIVDEGNQKENAFNLGFAARAKEEAATAVQEFNNAAKVISEGFSDIFGKSAKPMADFFKAFTDGMAAQVISQEKYNKTVLAYKGADIVTKEKVERQALAKQKAEDATSTVRFYGDAAGAASQFFDKQSTGYKTLQAVSQVFHAAEMAMTFALNIQKGIGAVLNQGQGDVYSAFARMATMAAIVVGLGVALSGGGGSASQNSAAARQERQGTGSVLGDADAKSESIVNSLKIIERDSGLGLVHFQSMDNSLKAVVAGLSSLGSNLVQFGGINNLTKQIASNQSGGWLGSVISSIFGGKTSVQDAGVMFNANTVGGVASSGIRAQSYNDIKKSGGWFSSDSYHTETKDLGADVNQQIADIISNMANTISAAATQLGMGGTAFEEHLKSFVVDLGKISLKDLKGDEVNKALEAIFSKLGDDMAAFSVAGLESFRKVGEGYLETLARVANELIQVQDVFAVLGKTMNAVGVEAIGISQSLINVFGDVDKLTTSTKNFIEDFLTEAERIVPIQNSLNAEFTRLHLATNMSVDDFKRLVMSQDLTTLSGQQMYAALLNIAPAFKQVADAAETAAKAVKAEKEAYEQLIKDHYESLKDIAKSDFDVLSKAVAKAKNDARLAYEAQVSILNSQVSAIQTSLTKISAIGSMLDSALASMLENAEISMKRSTAQALLNGFLRDANTSGKLPDADALKPVLSTLGKDSSNSFGSYQAFAKDMGITAGKLFDLDKIANTQKTIAQHQLDVAKAQLVTLKSSYDAQIASYDLILNVAQEQLDSMNGNTVAIKSLGDALGAFNHSALYAANTGVANNLGTPLSSATGDQVTSLYRSILGRDPDSVGYAFYTGTGETASSVANSLLHSTEYASLHPDGSHASGLDSVPFDGYTARLHKGEMVLPAKQAQNVAGSADMNNIVDAIMKLIIENKEDARKQYDVLMKQYKLLRDAMPLGDRMQTNEIGTT